MITINIEKTVNERMVTIGKSMILLAFLFLSNFIIGTISFQAIFFSAQDLAVGGMFFALLPGAISTAVVYFIYSKLPFMKKIILPSKVFKNYMLIQGIVMMVIEPLAVFISIMATDAPGSGVREQLYGFTFIWLPVNGVLWLGLALFLLVKKEKQI